VKFKKEVSGRVRHAKYGRKVHEDEKLHSTDRNGENVISGE